MWHEENRKGKLKGRVHHRRADAEDDKERESEGKGFVKEEWTRRKMARRQETEA